MSGATLDFDINQVPFSRRGAWINLSPVTALHTRSDDLHLVSHQTGMHAVLSLIPVVHGSRVATGIRATPAKLTWTSGSGTIEAVFEATDTVRFRGRGLDLRIADASIALTPFTGTYLFEDPVDRSYVFTSYESGRRYRLTCPSGVLIAEGSEALREHQRSVVVTGPDGWEIVSRSSRPAALRTSRPEASTRFTGLYSWSSRPTSIRSLSGGPTTPRRRSSRRTSCGRQR